jgi:predicted NBD/HSP70 family sugar kinase
MLKYFRSNASALNGLEKKKFRTRQRIIKYLFLNEQGSCNEIARHIKLSSPSVQASINKLVAEQLVEDIGQGLSTGGRRPIQYGLKKGTFFILCIDVCRFHVKMAILNSKFRFVSDMQSHEITFKDDAQYLDHVCVLAEELIKSTGIEREKLVGIGLDMPGVINSAKGINFSYFYNPDEALTKTLERRFGCPVFLENDTNVIAQTEHWKGRAKGAGNALILQLSWGIGLGMILNGKLYTGYSGFAGEFSHIPAKENGKLCWCNKRGCLETVASASALSAKIKEGLSNGELSSFSKEIDPNKEYIDPSVVINAAKMGDQFAVNCLSEVGFELGKGLSILIQIFNPEVIVLCDAMSRAGQYIITPIRHTLNSYCNPLIINDVRIELSDFGEEAAILGSGMMVADTLLSGRY